MQILMAMLLVVLGVVLVKAGMSSAGATLFGTLFSTPAAGSSSTKPKQPQPGGGGGVHRFSQA